MALIDLSDWLDRFGATSSRGVQPSDLESLRIVPHASESARAAPKNAAPGRLRIRWNCFWKRALRRLKRQPRGPA